MQGILVQTVAFVGVTIAIGRATDLKTGIVDSPGTRPWLVRPAIAEKA